MSNSEVELRVVVRGYGVDATVTGSDALGSDASVSKTVQVNRCLIWVGSSYHVF